MFHKLELRRQAEIIGSLLQQSKTKTSCGLEATLKGNVFQVQLLIKFCLVPCNLSGCAVTKKHQLTYFTNQQGKEVTAFQLMETAETQCPSSV